MKEKRFPLPTPADLKIFTWGLVGGTKDPEVLDSMSFLWGWGRGSSGRAPA
jgi:hypothetical protein